MDEITKQDSLELTPTQKGLGDVGGTIGRIEKKLDIQGAEAPVEKAPPVQSRVDLIIETLRYLNERLQRIEGVVEKI